MFMSCFVRVFSGSYLALRFLVYAGTAAGTATCTT